jgi:hypothetical protein
LPEVLDCALEVCSLLGERDSPVTDRTAASLCGAATIFVVQDVLRSVEHYRDVLGFRIEFTYGDPTFFAGVERPVAR